MAVVLRVVSEANHGRQITITIPEFKIGRDPTCHLRPASSDISRVHCAIVQRQGRAFLRDYGSSNGTILNRRKLVKGELELEQDDLIQVGPLAFRVRLQKDIATAETKFDLKADSVAEEAENVHKALLGDEEPTQDKTVIISSADFDIPAIQSPGDAGLAISLD